jgi:hypothetical protein
MAKTAQKTKAQHRAQLARDIASILANPETPATLYNAIGEEVCEWSTDYCNAASKTPAYIKTCLTHYQQKEAERTGGAR